MTRRLLSKVDSGVPGFTALLRQVTSSQSLPLPATISSDKEAFFPSLERGHEGILRKTRPGSPPSAGARGSLFWPLSRVSETTKQQDIMNVCTSLCAVIFPTWVSVLLLSTSWDYCCTLLVRACVVDDRSAYHDAQGPTSSVDARFYDGSTLTVSSLLATAVLVATSRESLVAGPRRCCREVACFSQPTLWKLGSQL